MELISKDEAIKQIDEAFDMGDCYCDKFAIRGILKSLPAIEERKEGHWGYTDDMDETFVCSVCGFDTEDYVKYNYCPNCGARMKGE